MQPLTNGAQVKTGSCNPTPMGVIGAQAKAPTSKFVNPPNLATIQSNQDFTVQMAINNVSARSESSGGRALTHIMSALCSSSRATLCVVA